MARQQIRQSEIQLTNERGEDCGAMFFIQVKRDKQWAVLDHHYIDRDERDGKFAALLKEPGFKR
mgnify:CR=1 FL=1